MYDMHYHNATDGIERNHGTSAYPTGGDQPWVGGSTELGAPWAYRDQESTPTALSQPKVIRRDHEQTSPRLPYGGNHGHQASTPPRVRIGPSNTNNDFETNAAAQTGLTPMAAQLNIAGNQFSSSNTVHNAYQGSSGFDWAQQAVSQNYQQQQQQLQAGTAGVSPYQHAYQQQYSHIQPQNSNATGYSSGPLAAGLSNLHPAIPGTAAPVVGPGTHGDSLRSHSWLPFNHSAQQQHQSTAATLLQQPVVQSSHQHHVPALGNHLQAAAAAPTNIRSQADPSWPYLPGFAVVESPINATIVEIQPPQQQVVQRHHNPQPTYGSVAAPRHEQTGVQHSYSLRSMAAGKSPGPGGAIPCTNQSNIPAASPGAVATSPVTPLPQQSQAQALERSSELRRGMAPTTALRALGHLLTTFEKNEVFEYQEVWFVGRSTTQKIRGSMRNGLPNGGFDDIKGDYNAVPGDHVAYRYEILGSLGKGSFGQVLKCIDHATGKTIALKMIRSKSRFQRQAKVEASILSTLSSANGVDRAGIVRMLESFTFRSHLCITFELLGANLYEHIKSHGFAGLPVNIVRTVAYQVLNTLVFLRDFNIVHCDLKPENILLVSRGSYLVKVIDFGSSCYADQRVFTYIQSRFYRAPEVILGLKYGPAIDMWSLACVLAELCTGTPLFPGEDEVDQMAFMLEVLNLPPKNLLAESPRAKLFFDLSTGLALPTKPNSQGRVHRAPGTKPLASALRGRADVLFLDFLAKCLQWDPEKRLTPEQALKHPWILAERASDAPSRSVGPLESAAAMRLR